MGGELLGKNIEKGSEPEASHPNLSRYYFRFTIGKSPWIKSKFISALGSTFSQN
jgi:hypothetical protein